MLDRTRDLWNKQHQLVGDRIQLFTAVAQAVEATTVLYPGSYVDLPSSSSTPTTPSRSTSPTTRSTC